MAKSLAGAWWDMCMTNWTTAVRLGETAVASQSVIESRIGTIGDAIRNPRQADYRELSGMVTEKATALSQSGAAIAGDLLAIQRESALAMMQFGAMMARGSAPNVRDVAAISARSTRIAEHASGAAARALAPVHAKATANARRLGKRKA